jgi:hypothetical protein
LWRAPEAFKNYFAFSIAQVAEVKPQKYEFVVKRGLRRGGE